jgi:hypothetical protein
MVERCGNGASVWGSGHKYEGEYKDDELCGQGTFTFADGSKVMGEWRNSELNGYAIRYDPAAGNITQKGIYKDNKWLHDNLN